MTSTEVTDHADAAYQAVRAINHATITAAYPAPVVYEVLGSLRRLGPGLDQALDQLGTGLHRSLDLYQVYEDDGTDPVLRVTETIDLFTRARAHANALGDLLGRAQSAIARQGYRDTQD